LKDSSKLSSNYILTHIIPDTILTHENVVDFYVRESYGKYSETTRNVLNKLSSKVVSSE